MPSALENTLQWLYNKLRINYLPTPNFFINLLIYNFLNTMSKHIIQTFFHLLLPQRLKIALKSNAFSDIIIFIFQQATLFTRI